MCSGRNRGRCSVILVACIALLGSLPAWAEWHTQRQAIMGTEVSVTLWHEQAAQADMAIAAVMEEMRRIDAALSPYKEESELSQLNKLATAGPQPLLPL